MEISAEQGLSELFNSMDLAEKSIELAIEMGEVKVGREQLVNFKKWYTSMRKNIV